MHRELGDGDDGEADVLSFLLLSFVFYLGVAFDGIV
jgi:hypothetical protein